MAQRRHSPQITRDLDRLAEIMRGVPRERVAAVLDRSVRVNFNVTPQQHEEIKSTADALGLNVTEYFTRLHDLARRELHGTRSGRRLRPA